MRVGSLDAPKIATEAGARSGASGCAVIVGAIAAEPGAGASKSETRFGATLSAAFRLCGLAPEMTGDPVARSLFFQRRRVLGTEGQLPDRAAGVEMAAGGRVDRVRHVALQHDAAALDAWIRDRHRG